MRSFDGGWRSHSSQESKSTLPRKQYDTDREPHGTLHWNIRQLSVSSRSALQWWPLLDLSTKPILRELGKKKAIFLVHFRRHQYMQCFDIPWTHSHCTHEMTKDAVMWDLANCPRWIMKDLQCVGLAHKTRIGCTKQCDTFPFQSLPLSLFDKGFIDFDGALIILLCCFIFLLVLVSKQCPSLIVKHLMMVFGFSGLPGSYYMWPSCNEILKSFIHSSGCVTSRF